MAKLAGLLKKTLPDNLLKLTNALKDNLREKYSFNKSTMIANQV
jgi:hypothetical protein